jgi:hypothetical protein
MMATMSDVLLHCCAAGIIKVTYQFNSALVGYVSATYVNSFGRFDITGNTTNALSVTITQGSKQNMFIKNGPNPGTYPFLGFVVGPTSSNNDLASGSSNYILLTSTAVTLPGSPPQNVGNAYNGDASESAIWTADGNYFITAQWVNSDLTLPPTILFDISGGLLATGDPGQFQQDFVVGSNVVFQVV